jgi:hypothetical protein
MLNNNKATRSEILAIIDTIEGMLKQPGGWLPYHLEEWTKWKAELALLEGR